MGSQDNRNRQGLAFVLAVLMGVLKVFSPTVIDAQAIRPQELVAEDPQVTVARLRVNGYGYANGDIGRVILFAVRDDGQFREVDFISGPYDLLDRGRLGFLSIENDRRNFFPHAFRDGFGESRLRQVQGEGVFPPIGQNVRDHRHLEPADVLEQNRVMSPEQVQFSHEGRNFVYRRYLPLDS